jgi:transcriptional regulator with XRE-family HTH domain
MDSPISKILRERLHGQNLTKVARELGISKSLLADWTASRRLPSLKNIDAVAKISAYLGLSLEHLLLGKDSERKVVSSVCFTEDGREYQICIERKK